MAFIQLNKLLKRTVKKTNLENKVEAVWIMDEFEKQVKKLFKGRFDNKIKPLYFKNGTLKVSVISSILSHQLKLKEDLIIKSVNKRFKKNIIKKISFSL